jgi:hypothetical protein
MQLLHDRSVRDRLISKIKDRRQFWSTVPEIVWAARFRRLGMNVNVEPIIGRTGPDMRFTWNGFTAHAEVYSPVFEADEFSWADDLQEDLECLDVGYHVSCQLLPDRLSENRGVVSKTLRRVISELKAKDDPTPYYRLYLRRDRSHRMVELPGYRTLGFDPVLEEENDLLFVTDLHRMPEVGAITIGTHVSNGHRNARELLRDLGQLQPGANLLIIARWARQLRAVGCGTGVKRGAHVSTSCGAFFVERGVVKCIALIERGGCTVVESTATSSVARTQARAAAWSSMGVSWPSTSIVSRSAPTWARAAACCSTAHRRGAIESGGHVGTSGRAFLAGCRG